MTHEAGGGSEWYFADQHGRVGPLTFEELCDTFATIESVQSQKVLVWRRGYPNWKPIRDVSDIHRLRLSPGLFKNSLPPPLPGEATTAPQYGNASGGSSKFSTLTPRYKAVFVGIAALVIGALLFEEAALKAFDPVRYLARLEKHDETRWLAEMEVIDPERFKTEVAYRNERARTIAQFKAELERPAERTSQASQSPLNPSLARPVSPRSSLDNLIGVYGILFVTGRNCPHLKQDKNALAEIFIAAGIRQAEFFAPAMQQKLWQESLAAESIFETLDSVRKVLLCERVYEWYGPAGTVEPGLLEWK